MKTLESIFSEIKENGVITKQQLQLLKNRSNKQQQDVIDYDWLESNVYGYRELDIISNASPSDFVFKGFYDAGNGGFRNFLPIYHLNEMEYIPMKEPYIVG